MCHDECTFYDDYMTIKQHFNKCDESINKYYFFETSNEKHIVGKQLKFSY